MQTDVKELLVNQSKWQRSRKSAPWGDKIREVERVRESLGAYKYRADQVDRRIWVMREAGDTLISIGTSHD